MTEVYVAYCQPSPDDVELIGVFATLLEAQMHALQWALEEREIGAYRSLEIGNVWREHGGEWSIMQDARSWNCGALVVIETVIGRRAMVDDFGWPEGKE